VRSRAAAGVLASAGFPDAATMEGGFRVWQGLDASGSEDAGMSYFPEDAPLDLFIALLWSMEEGAGRFYGAVAEALDESPAARVFSQLAGAEGQHRQALEDLSGGVGTIQAKLGEIGLAPGQVMEGGGSLQEALERIAGADPSELLQVAMAFETNAYDLYLKMERKAKDEEVVELFRKLAMEEKAHLVRLGRVLEETL